MIESKVFEIRDRMTCIPALAVRIVGGPGDRKRHIVWHAGFGPDGCVLLVHLQTPKCQHDAYAWADRTMQAAHAFIEENWSTLEDGALIDVRVILKESAKPCESEFPAA